MMGRRRARGVPVARVVLVIEVATFRGSVNRPIADVDGTRFSEKGWERGIAEAQPEEAEAVMHAQPPGPHTGQHLQTQPWCR